jgi:hypothetical protein
MNKSPRPVNMPPRMPAEVEEKFVHLRRTSTFVGVDKVLFTGRPATFRVYGEGTRIRAVVPVGARSGWITVVNPAGRAKTATSFTVRKDYLRGTWYSGRHGIALTIGSLRMTTEYGFHRCTWRYTANGQAYRQTLRIRRSGAYWKGEDKTPVRIWQRSRTRLYVTWVGATTGGMPRRSGGGSLPDRSVDRLHWSTWQVCERCRPPNRSPGPWSVCERADFEAARSRFGAPSATGRCGRPAQALRRGGLAASAHPPPASLAAQVPRARQRRTCGSPALCAGGRRGRRAAGCQLSRLP